MTISVDPDFPLGAMKEQVLVTLRDQQSYERRAFIRAASVQLLSGLRLGEEDIRDDVDLAIGVAKELWDALEREVP